MMCRLLLRGSLQTLNLQSLSATHFASLEPFQEVTEEIVEEEKHAQLVKE